MKRSISLLLALFALAAAPLRAAPRWTLLGPVGGSAFSFTPDPAHPGVVYATAGEHGTFKTVDGGATWMGIQRSNAYANLAVDPVRTSTLYLPAWPGTLLKSGDGGAHWAAINKGLPAGGPGFIRFVRVDPAQRTRLYLATGAGVWRSLDAGASWQKANAGLLEGAALPPPVSALVAVRPAGTVFAATSFGLYRSTDGANSWRRLTRGLPAGNVSFIAPAPSDPQTLYVLFTDRGLYRTTNGGSSWKPAVGPPARSTEIFSLVVDPRSPTTLYTSIRGGAVLRSTDGALHWPETGRLPGDFPVAVTPDPLAPRRLYASLLETLSMTGGVYRSDDGGATWQRRSVGYAALTALSLAVAPDDPERLWTHTSSALFRSGGRGLPWTRVSLPLSFMPKDPRSLAAVSSSTLFLRAAFGTDLWKTDDAGASWAPLHAPRREPIRLFRLAPSAPSVLYALEGSSFPVIGGADLRTSADGGATWETRARGLSVGCALGDLAVAPSAAQVLYVTGGAPDASASCARPVAKVYRSRDGGATFTDTSAGASAGLPVGPVTQATVDPGDPDTAYVALGGYIRTPGDGVWKTEDGGATWTRAGTELAGKTVVALLATDLPGRVYATLDDDRVFRSEDGGGSWEDVTGTLFATAIYQLVADPADPGRVYAATGNGIWMLEED